MILPPSAVLAKHILSFDAAVQCLEEGGLVLYPTETFFAVGCRMEHSQSLERIYAAKSRSLQKPLPILAHSWEQVRTMAEVSPAEARLAEQFWPGPLTLLLRAKAHISPFITAHTGRVAVRISPHPTARALALRGPLVCSSANISGKDAPQFPEHIDAQLLERVDGVVIDGPSPKGGLASTIVLVRDDGSLDIRRHGAVAQEELLTGKDDA